MIRLTEDWYIDADNYNVILQHRYENEKGKEAFNLKTYHKDMRGALKRYVQRLEEDMIEHSNFDIQRFLNEYERITKSVEKVIDEVKK